MKCKLLIVSILNFCCSSFNINYAVFIRRKALIIRNRYLRPKPYTCSYCDGGGFIDCRKCYQGCWRCEKSTLTDCPFCSGSGTGKLLFAIQ